MTKNYLLIKKHADLDDCALYENHPNPRVFIRASVHYYLASMQNNKGG